MPDTILQNSIQKISFTDYATRSKILKNESNYVMSDRYKYYDSDKYAQFYAKLNDSDYYKIEIEIQDNTNSTIDLKEKNISHDRISFLVDVQPLLSGIYKIKVRTFDHTNNPSDQVERRIVKETSNPNNLPRFIDINLQQQKHLDNCLWPTHATIPLPNGLATADDKFVLIERENIGGRQSRKFVPAFFDKRVTKWGKSSYIKWLHVYFLGKYQNGLPKKYSLEINPRNQFRIDDRPYQPVKYTRDDSGNGYTIENGYIKFHVGKPFDGITDIYYDPNGEANYSQISQKDQNKKSDPSGPYIIDINNKRWATVYDSPDDTKMEIELPLKPFDSNTEIELPLESNDENIGLTSDVLIIKFQGNYRNNDPNHPNPSYRNYPNPSCRYITRIRVQSGSPMIKIEHSTILNDYTNTDFLIKEHGFHIPLLDCSNFILGADDKIIKNSIIDIPGSNPPDGQVYAHQQKHDQFEIDDKCNGALDDVNGRDVDGMKYNGKKIDGWFDITATGKNISLFVKDFWQKFPKEVGINRNGLTYYIWPKNGKIVYDRDDETSKENIYKFLCFHQRETLDLQVPQYYINKLDQPAYRNELERNASPQFAQGTRRGITIHNEFALYFSPKSDPQTTSSLYKIYDQNPIAFPTQNWIEKSKVVGEISEQISRFDDIEKSIMSSIIGYANPERGENYGMFNYGDTNHKWLTSQDRASLYRVWFNNHYSITITLWLLSIARHWPKILEISRRYTDHYINIDQINTLQTDYRNGFFYHCKAISHWGSELPGFTGPERQREDHSNNQGHFVDPTGVLLSWLVDANRWSKDSYETWLYNIKNNRYFDTSKDRENNSSFYQAMIAYEYTYNPMFLPAIKKLAEVNFIKPFVANVTLSRDVWEITSVENENGTTFSLIPQNNFRPGKLFKFIIDNQIPTSTPVQIDPNRYYYAGIQEDNENKFTVHLTEEDAIKGENPLRFTGGRNRSYKIKFGSLVSNRYMADRSTSNIDPKIDPEKIPKIPSGNKDVSTWNPLWVTKYYEFTRDSTKNEFIILNAKDTGSLGLAAIAYDITTDDSFLLKYSYMIRFFAETILKTQDPSSKYNNFGLALYVLSDKVIPMTWIFFLKRLKEASLRQIPFLNNIDGEYGCYPSSASNFSLKNNLVQNSTGNPSVAPDVKGLITYVLDNRRTSQLRLRLDTHDLVDSIPEFNISILKSTSENTVGDYDLTDEYFRLNPNNWNRILNSSYQRDLKKDWLRPNNHYSAFWKVKRATFEINQSNNTTTDKLYRLENRGYQNWIPIYQPINQNDLPECSIIKNYWSNWVHSDSDDASSVGIPIGVNGAFDNNVNYKCPVTIGYMLPLIDEEILISFIATSDRKASNNRDNGDRGPVKLTIQDPTNDDKILYDGHLHSHFPYNDPSNPENKTADFRNKIYYRIRRKPLLVEACAKDTMLEIRAMTSAKLPEVPSDLISDPNRIPKDNYKTELLLFGRNIDHLKQIWEFIRGRRYQY